MPLVNFTLYFQGDSSSSYLHEPGACQMVTVIAGMMHGLPFQAQGKCINVYLGVSEYGEASTQL